MPLRGPDNKEYDGSQDGWTDSESEEPQKPRRRAKKRLAAVEPELRPEISEEPLAPVDEETAEEVTQLLSKEEVLVTGDKDKETGMLPVILRKVPQTSPEVPGMRGRHVGSRALSILSRMPLVGLKYLRESAEFVVYDDQPPPSGEYAVQALGITTIEYNGVQQNHLLVSFKAGQLTGFAVEDTYTTLNQVYPAGLVDFPIDLATPLAGRSARTIAVSCNRNIVIKLNSDTNDQMLVAANMSPFVIDLGLNIDTMFLTTTKETSIHLEAW